MRDHRCRAHGQFNAPRLPWPYAAGAALGLVALLPFHALRWMGAGDVKFFSVLGLMLGWQTPADLIAASPQRAHMPRWCWRHAGWVQYCPSACKPS